MVDRDSITDTERPGSLPVVDSPCRHLRAKGMYVYTDGPCADHEDGYDNSIYWCLHTMKSFGPDDQFVGGCECRNPGRDCHEPI